MQYTSMSEPVMEFRDPFLQVSDTKVSGLVSVSKATGLATVKILKSQVSEFLMKSRSQSFNQVSVSTTLV